MDAVDERSRAVAGHYRRPPERSLVWRELLSGYNLSDVASVIFRDRFGCWGFLDLWRLGGRHFTDPEADYLGA